MNIIIEGVLNTIDSSIVAEIEESDGGRQPLSITVKYLDDTTKVLDEKNIVELQKTMDVTKQKLLFHDVKKFNDAGDIKYHATFDADGRAHGFSTYIYENGTKIRQQRVNHGHIMESADYMADTNVICSYTRYYKIPSGFKHGFAYYCEYDNMGYKHGTESLNFDVNYSIEWEHGVAVGSVALQAINEIHNDAVKFQEKIKKLEARLNQDDLLPEYNRLLEFNKQCIAERDELKKENASLMDAVKKLARENTYFQKGLVQKENEELKSQLTELKRIINGPEKS